MTQKPENDDTGPPFGQHAVYYRVLKVAVLAAAVVLALKMAGVW